MSIALSQTQFRGQPGNPAPITDAFHPWHAGHDPEESRPAWFRPAFLDTSTGRVYPSCFKNGTPAPVHCLDGLPESLARHTATETRLSQHVVAGFERGGCFFTREEVAMLAQFS